MSADSDDEGGFMGDLFVCEDYVEKTWEFDDIVQPLLCSNMSSTDHDLTGQIVWPASVYGAWFVTRHKELFRDKTVIELGAGCGLVGFVANHIASKTIITDGNDVVLRLLDRNIEAMNKRGENDSQKCSVTPLLWGFKQNVSDLVSKCGEVDVIVGADVLLWPGYVRPLFMTIRWLLSFRPKTSRCYISYVTRATSTSDRVIKAAAELDLIIEYTMPDSFLSQEIIEKQFKGLEIKMISLRIASPEGVSFATEPMEKEELVEGMGSSAPC